MAADLILNGYASWVYMEEILGRATQYRAFWWSPDSKKIAFFRSDDLKFRCLQLLMPKDSMAKLKIALSKSG